MTTPTGAGHLPDTEPSATSAPSGRHQKWQKRAERYLGGQARAPYKQHDSDLSRSFGDDSQLACEEPLPNTRRGECSACPCHLQKLAKVGMGKRDQKELEGTQFPRKPIEENIGI